MRIDGAKARVATTASIEAPAYRALIRRPSLVPGRRYTVTIRVSRRGRDLVRTERLSLHRKGRRAS